MTKTSRQDQCCMNCNYWSGTKKDTEHFCRRHAPRPFVTEQSDNIAGWPNTWDADWCGEWEATL